MIFKCLVFSVASGHVVVSSKQNIICSLKISNLHRNAYARCIFLATQVLIRLLKLTILVLFWRQKSEHQHLAYFLNGIV